MKAAKFVPLLILIVVVAVAPLWASHTLLDRLIFAGIYGIAGLGVGLLLGQCGILNLAQGAFYGIGAYATAALSVEYHVHPLLAGATGMTVSGLLAAIIGWPILRLNGYFLALATLALGMIASELFFEWDWLTGGTFGIGGIPALSFFGGWTINTPARHYILVWGVLGLCLLLTHNLRRSRIGLAMSAMRDAPEAASVAAVEVHVIRVQTLVLCATFGALAGSLFAHYATFVSVQSFGLEQSILFLLIPVIGGARSLIGILVGALFVALVPEFLSKLGDIHHVLFGLALVIVVMVCPDGLTGLWHQYIARRRFVRETRP